MKRLLALVLVLPMLFAVLQPQQAQARNWEWFVKNTHPGPHCAGAPTPTTYYGGRGLGVATYNHPKGTRLRFTNCNNGKWVDVVVNDRGPGKRQRNLGIHYDLSYRAAAKIALGQNGRFESGWTSVTVIGSADAGTTEMSARRHARHRGGYGLICAKVQAHYFGGGSACATTWAHDHPQTTAHAGAVVVQSRGGGRNGCPYGPGHLSRIVRMTGSCTAIVADEKGQYERNICVNLIAYVEGNASYATNYSAATTKRTSRQSRRGRHERVARAVMPDRMTEVH